MGILRTVFANNGERARVFKGQGYTEEEAQLHAEQRLLAFIRDEEKQKISFNIISKQMSFKQSNELITKCYIKLHFTIKKR